jgi:hypothetical protein
MQQFRGGDHIPPSIRSFQATRRIRMVCGLEHCWIFCNLALCPRDKSADARRAGPRYASLSPVVLQASYSSALSLLGSDAHPCRLPDQSATTQHQEIYFPHEGRSLTATVRTRGRPQGEALRPWRCWPRMTVVVHSEIFDKIFIPFLALGVCWSITLPTTFYGDSC